MTRGHYFPLVSFVTAGVTQRIGVKTLIANGVDDIVLINVLTFFGMLVAALTLPEARQVLRYSTNNPWNIPINAYKYPALTVSCITELVGGVLQVVTLSLLTASNQSIISRGTELFGVVIIERFVMHSMNSRSQLSNRHMTIVSGLLLTGSMVIPMLSQLGDLGFTLVAVLLVVIRSLLFSVQTVAEHISLHNYAVAPGSVLVIEGSVGLVLTVTIVWPLFAVANDVRMSESFENTLKAVSEDPWKVYLAVFMVFVFGYQNWARLNLIDRFSAVAKEVAAALRPGLIFATSLALYYTYYAISGSGGDSVVLGEPFELGPGLVTLSCFLVILIGNILYFCWVPRLSQLYVKGRQHIHEDNMKKKRIISRVNRICASGMKYQSSSIGCYALDEGDYDVGSPIFPLFQYVAEQYHGTKVLPVNRTKARKEVLNKGGHYPHATLDTIFSKQRPPTTKSLASPEVGVSSATLTTPSCFDLEQEDESEDKDGTPAGGGRNLDEEMGENHGTKVVKTVITSDTIQEFSLENTRHELPAASQVLDERWSQVGIDLHHVRSLRIRVARNFAGYDFAPSISTKDREQLADKVYKALISDIDDETGLCKWAFEDYCDRLDLWPVREFRVMRAAGILRDWPSSRFVATYCVRHQQEEEVDTGAGESLQRREHQKVTYVTVLVNEEDHLRLVATVETPSRGHTDLSKVLELLSSVESFLEKYVGQYAYNDYFGYLASCPTNVGTGFKISTRGATGVNYASEIRLNKSVQEIVCKHFESPAEHSPAHV